LLTYSAEMQLHDWNDLKYVIALHRGGSLKRAARSVGTSETTVARRIRVLEERLGVVLFRRGTTGRYEATDEAMRVLEHIDAIEAQHAAIAEKLRGSADRVSGTVRVSSVPMIVNRILVPALPSLFQAHPDLAVELVPTGENLDLSKREADLAVRFARPSQGGLKILSQKLGVIGFGAYAPTKTSERYSVPCEWITYDEAHADLPQAAWMERMAARSGHRVNALRVADVETAVAAVAAGLGQTLLPSCIGDRQHGIRRIEADNLLPFPDRDVWLLSHADQATRLSITVVKTWLANLDWR
jgi:DNA-binding transcriptional LysR family regulator